MVRSLRMAGGCDRPQTRGPTWCRHDCDARMTTRPITVPRLTGGLPLLGHALEFYRDPVKLIQRGRDLHGDIFSLRLFGQLIHVVTGAAGNAAFFKAPDAVLSVNEAYRFTVPIFGKGLVYDVGPELMDQQLC